MGKSLENREFAKSQIKRLTMLVGFPRDTPEAIADLTDALMTAPSEEYARDAITSFVEEADSETRCPFPKDIRAAVLQLLREREGEILPDPLCPKCKGAGDVIVEKNGYTSSYRCSCHARRPPVDYSKLPGVEKFDMSELVAGAAKQLGSGR
jgi:hypothetical protein